MVVVFGLATPYGWFEISLFFFCFGELNVSLARDLVSHWQGLHALGATWRILLPTNFFFRDKDLFRYQIRDRQIGAVQPSESQSKYKWTTSSYQ